MYITRITSPMNKKWLRMATILLLMFTITMLNDVHISSAHEHNWLPAPYQDEQSGRNSHVYLPENNGPTAEQQRAFIEHIQPHAIRAHETWGPPASAIIGMAILESGYGTTRIAYYANNLFGIKVWGENPNNAWQLKGQPDEDGERSVPVIANYGSDQKVYDESGRRDNWYRSFSSYSESVDHLAGSLLVNDRYQAALDAYERRIQEGMSLREASKLYAFDIAQAGYNHHGGNYYREAVGDVMDQWDLYQYDSAHSQHNNNYGNNDGQHAAEQNSEIQTTTNNADSQGLDDDNHIKEKALGDTANDENGETDDSNNPVDYESKLAEKKQLEIAANRTANEMIAMIYKTRFSIQHYEQWKTELFKNWVVFPGEAQN